MITIRLFKKFNISCIAFSKRDKVLEDFSKSFPEDRGILRGNTDAETPPESCPSFLDSRDSKPLPASQTLYTHVQTSALTGCKEKLLKSF